MLVLGYHWELLFIAWSQQILEVAICEQTVLGPVNDSQATTLAALTLSTFFFFKTGFSIAWDSLSSQG